MKKMMSVTGLCAVALVGCVDGAQTVDDEAMPAAMASAERAGAKVDVYEVAAGDLMVVATGAVPEGLEGKAPVEIYEVIARAPAPAALVERQAAIAAKQRPSLHVGEMSSGKPARAGEAELTASEFQSANCSPGTVDFDLCFTNSTNDFSRTFTNIKWIHSHLNAYRGTVSHSMRYRAFLGSWHQIDFDSTTGTSFVSTFNEQDNGDYEVIVSNASGDGYHLAMHGDF